MRELFFKAAFDVAPMVAESLAGGFEDRAVVRFRHRADFQSGRHRRFGQRFVDVAGHFAEITRGPVALACEQSLQAVFAAVGPNLEKFLAGLRLTGCDLAHARFGMLEHGRADTFAPPIRVQETNHIVE